MDGSTSNGLQETRSLTPPATPFKRPQTPLDKPVKLPSLSSAPKSTSTISDLRSQEHRNLFDIIDRLRSQGISRYVDLPQLIVCGDQSSGKSSVLEAISGLTFPTKDNACTRFATEVVLRRTPGPEVTCKASIRPDPERPQEECDLLSEFNPPIDLETLNLDSVVEKAKEAMGIGEGKKFTNDVLKVELSGPEQPHLTLVDLPGLFFAENKDQTLEDAQVVMDMVLQYVKLPRSIILAVVSAKNDFNNQKVTAITREHDPQGHRTLGVITKPDMLHDGSDSQNAFIDLALNKDVYFRLGWHILRNRDYPERHHNLAQRHETEREFFSKKPWNTMDQFQLGAASLKPRLSEILKDQILEQLNSLVADVERGISECRNTLKQLGIPRDTPADQKRYLVNVSKDLSRLLEGASNGDYADGFFGDAWSEKGARIRLRAFVQNALTEFAVNMRSYGHSHSIIETQKEEGSSSPARQEIVGFDVELTDPPRNISRDNYVNNVKMLMCYSRGKELPGLFNPLIVGELFALQCKRWSVLVNLAKDDILKALSDFVDSALDHVVIPETKFAILQKLNDRLDQLRANLDEKIQELLEPQQTRHPITYNHYLTETVQKLQNQRWKKTVENRIMQLFNVKKLGEWHTEEKSLNLAQVASVLAENTELDMETYAASSATDYMQAYYQVSLKSFIDNFSSLAIEKCVMEEIPALFSRDMIEELEDADIEALARESGQASSERLRATTKLADLEAGLRELTRLNKHRRTISRPHGISELSEGLAIRKAAGGKEGNVSIAALKKTPLGSVDGSEGEDTNDEDSEGYYKEDGQLFKGGR